MKPLTLFLALLCGAVAQTKTTPNPGDIGQLLTYTTTGTATWRNPTIQEYYAWSPELKAEAADVVKAMKLLLDIADPSSCITVDAVYRSPAAQVQLYADQLKQREKDIAWARIVLAKWEARAK